MKFIKVFFLLSLFLLYGVQVCFSQDIFYVTEEQLTNLTLQIRNLQSNNLSMMNLLEDQKNELEKQKIDLENQTKEFQILETNYSEKFQIMDKQLKNSQQLLNRLETKNSIYKYSIAGALVLGLIVGIVVAK